MLLFTCCRLSDPSQYQSIVDAEWNIIYDKLDKCVQSGAKVVLSRLAIGDLATQVGAFCFVNALIYF
jgi:T-complex protein 1 subunit eta